MFTAEGVHAFISEKISTISSRSTLKSGFMKRVARLPNTTLMKSLLRMLLLGRSLPIMSSPFSRLCARRVRATPIRRW